MLSVLQIAVKGSLRLLLTVVFCFEPLHQVNIFFRAFESTDDNRSRAIEIGCSQLCGSKFDTDSSRHLSAMRRDRWNEACKEEDEEMLESK